jgi:hypothetical protein
MAGPLTANPHPAKFDTGPLGNVFVTGALTGLAQWQSNATRTDRAGQADISNGQVFIQKTDGVLRFFVETGLYSLPSLGTPYLRQPRQRNTISGRFRWFSRRLPRAKIGRSRRASYPR